MKFQAKLFIPARERYWFIVISKLKILPTIAEMRFGRVFFSPDAGILFIAERHEVDGTC